MNEVLILMVSEFKRREVLMLNVCYSVTNENLLLGGDCVF